MRKQAGEALDFVVSACAQFGSETTLQIDRIAPTRIDVASRLARAPVAS
jgi:hypothetical protein